MEFVQRLLQYAKNEEQQERFDTELETNQEEGTHGADQEGQQTIQISQEGTKNQKVGSGFDETDTNQTWSHNQTLPLISAYDNHKENFNIAKKHKFIWQDIANEMISNGYTISAAKCEVKWRNLQRTYKNVKDLQGRGAGKFRFFNQIDDIMGDKPSTSSPHTFGTTTTDGITNEKEGIIGNSQNLNNTEKKYLPCDKSTQKICPKRKSFNSQLDEALKKKTEDLISIKIQYLKKKEDDKRKELRTDKKIELKEKMIEIEQKKIALFAKFLEKANLK